MSARAAAALLLLVGCTRPVEQLERANQELAAGQLSAVEARIAEAYRDAIGGKAELRAGLEEILRGATSLEIRTPELTALRTEGPDRGTTLQGKLELSFEDKESGGWTLTGPLDVELDHSGQIRSGYLADLRDLIGLFKARRAALEANDAAALGALLHPDYRDGDRDKDATVRRLAEDLEGTPVRLRPLSYWAELRGMDAHVDERYELRVGEEPRRAVARFTLRKSAGRWRIFAGLYPP